MQKKPTYKQLLVDQVWNKKLDYYQKTDQGNAVILDGPHYRIVLEALAKADTLLEVGCGNGGTLKHLQSSLHPKVELSGVDISALAIKLARRNFPEGNFSVADGEQIPYEDEKFACTCSFFTFEHLAEPARVFEEMIRVTKPGGSIVIICPNYGAPIYPSPCSRAPIWRRLLHWIFSGGYRPEQSNFGWQPVTPIIDKRKTHIPDYDTLIEPNLDHFVSAIDLEYPGLKFEVVTSLWSTVRFSPSPPFFLCSLPFRILGLMGVRPFSYWGPLFVVVLRKKTERTTH